MVRTFRNLTKFEHPFNGYGPWGQALVSHSAAHGFMSVHYDNKDVPFDKGIKRLSNIKPIPGVQGSACAIQ